MTDNKPVLPQVCVMVRGGLELWVDESKREIVERELQNSQQRMIRISGELVNKAEVIGVLSASAVEEMRRRKNGQWTCKWGKWHDRKEVCEHTAPKPEPKYEIDEKTRQAKVVGYSKPYPDE